MTTMVTNYTQGINYRNGLGPDRLPALNLELLAELMEWAEYEDKASHGLIDRTSIPEQYRDWGIWDQGVWGFLVAPEGEQITDEDRRNWRNGTCKTAFCMAGQAAAQAGYRLVFTTYGDLRVGPDGEEVYGNGAHDVVLQEPTGEYTPRGYPIMRDVPGAMRRSVGSVGMEVLGLNIAEADKFFDGDNEFDILCRYANTFCAARNLPPLYPGMGLQEIDAHEYHTESGNPLVHPEPDYDPDDDED